MRHAGANEPRRQSRRRPVLRLAVAFVVMSLLAIARDITEGETHEEALKADVKDCILLFGAFCNGNMGDVVQPISMENLLASVAPPEQCFYYAHPVGEDPSRGLSIGKFFGGDEPNKLIRLSPRSAWKVNRFKALVIGGGGIFATKHAPLFHDKFAEAVEVPIVVMGVGASHVAKLFRTLLHKATFVSGRDTKSIDSFAGILGRGATSVVRPGDVRFVRDPVLSDKEFTDTTGACWKQSSGDHEQPLCFVLPAANSLGTEGMNRLLRDNVVRRGDRFINVFPKHQKELAPFEYPGTVEVIVDPMEYVKQLCSCKAIISTRFHGAILGLHMGVPTFGAFTAAEKNKVPDLMFDTMSLPDQFFLLDANLTREAVEQQVDTVRRSYDDDEGRRGAIHDRLSVFHEEFKAEARRMLDVLGVAHRWQPEQQNVASTQPDELSIRGGVGHLSKDEKESFYEEYSTLAGEDYVMAICLLFTIAELASMSSTIGLGGGPGNLQRPCEADTVDGDGKLASSDDRRASVVVRSCVQEDQVDAAKGTSTDRGLPRGGSAAMTRELSLLRRLGCQAARGASKPSNLLLALNFALWIALGVTFCSYTRSYLRDTRDPIGLLALQGVSSSVVLFVLRHCLGLGASDGCAPNDPTRNARGMIGLNAQRSVVSRREALVAVLHSGHAILTNLSIFVGDVAFTNALKAMEPVVAAVFSHLVLGKRIAPAGRVALAMAVAGILLLSSGGTAGGSHMGILGERTDAAGGRLLITGRILSSAVFTIASVSCNALRNVVIKKGDLTPPHHTLSTCSVAAGIVGVSIMLVRGIVRGMDKFLIGGENGVELVAAPQYGSWLGMNGVNSALCLVGYNLASLNLLARLSPVGHAVGNSVVGIVMGKRLNMR